jgi:hypothetical protein
LAYNRARAAKLLTAAELDHFNASLARDAGKLSEAQLKAKVKRSRALRDKYRDLLKRQTRKNRDARGGKAAARISSNERTAHKAKIFAEVLQRFEKHLARRTARDKRGARKIPIRSTAALVEKKRAAQARQEAARRVEVSAKAPSTGPRSSPRESEAQVLSDRQRFTTSGATAIQGHVSASVRGNQAKRDQRG